MSEEMGIIFVNYCEKYYAKNNNLGKLLK
jgi:hypothetical protein